MNNYFNNLYWEKILSENLEKSDFSIEEYYKILSPEFPDFLKEYSGFQSVQRLKNIGLLCGTDWTKLYKNKFYYSRFDHSIATALIIWNFTHNKIQTLSGLFHDISAPVFSHVVDFKNGDAITQSSTEKDTKFFIQNDAELSKKLKSDNIYIEEISNYHDYPICDNEMPKLSSDRLEYMFPSGAALHGIWNLNEIEKTYKNIQVLQNEENICELGFTNSEIAEKYTEKFLKTSHILQLNENKLTLQLLAEILKLSIEEKIISETDLYKISEKEVIERLELLNKNSKTYKYFKTFQNMTKIIHSEKPLENHFCVNLKVKQRFINPLIKTKKGIFRISEISNSTKNLIRNFLNFSDTSYGCVEFIN